jgi:glucosamine kinase
MTSTGDAPGFVIAVDAGGTHTRVACFGLDGSLLAATTGGGGSPFHNADSAQNVTDTIRRCLRAGGLDPRDALALVAGLAAISRAGSNQGDGDNGWAHEYFAIPSLSGARVILNDAVVAHRGALLGEPGVIVVAGTGSMILAITDDGTEVESGQFEHYAGAARHLVYEAMQQILAGLDGPDDREFVTSVLDYWRVATVDDLRTAILSLADVDRMRVRRRYGGLAPAVTAAADTSPLADRALRDLAAKTARGIQLLAPLIHSGPVPVATAGALATTDAYITRLSVALGEHPANRAIIVPTALDPMRGAALIGLQTAGVGIDNDLIDRLREGVTPASLRIRESESTRSL